MNALPSLDTLRDVLVRDDGTITAREQYELKLALRLMRAITYSPSSGQPCLVCGIDVTPTTPTMPILCTACVFWHDRLLTAERHAERRWLAGSIRFQGVHYILDLHGTPGPVMTIRFYSGVVIVTNRLKCQGPIPEQYLSRLPDNAIIVEGSPQNRPIGVYE